MGILKIQKHIFSITKITILGLLTFAFTSGAKIQIENKLVGSWKAIDYNGNTSEFIFTEEKLVTFSINGQRFGGEDFQINGKSVEVKYAVNDTKTPIWLDLVATDKETDAVLVKVKGIIEFINYNNVKILLNLDNKRITHFDEKYKKRVINLQR